MKKLILYSSTLALAVLWVVPTQAETPDGMTPAEEVFCDDNFEGRLRGLCNAFCEAMDCDDIEARASVTACKKLQEKIDPLLAKHNIDNGTSLEIFMADAMINEDGVCGEGEVACDKSIVQACDTATASLSFVISIAETQLRTDCENKPGKIVSGPETTIKTSVSSVENSCTATAEVRLVCERTGELTGMFNLSTDIPSAPFDVGMDVTADQAAVCNGPT